MLNDLIGPEEVDTVLRECACVLRRGGLFLADVREGEAHARRYARQPRGRLTSPDGVTLAFEARFDADTHLTTIDEALELAHLPHLRQEPIRHTWRMRTFRPAELTALLQGAGPTVHGLWGWCDQRPVGEGDRLTVLAQKA